MRRDQGRSVGEFANVRNPEQGKEMKLAGVSCLFSSWWLLEGLCLLPGQEESRAPVEAPRSSGGRFWMWLEGQLYIYIYTYSGMVLKKGRQGAPLKRFFKNCGLQRPFRYGQPFPVSFKWIQIMNNKYRGFSHCHHCIDKSTVLDPGICHTR